MFYHLNLSEPSSLLSHAEAHVPDSHPIAEARRQERNLPRKSQRPSKRRSHYHIEDEDSARGGSFWRAAPAGRVSSRWQQQREGEYHRRSPYEDPSHSPEPQHLDLYCQKNLLPCGRRSPPPLERNFSFLGGIMYPAPSDGGLGRSFNCALWPQRVPFCRPRFVKLLLVVMLLMMAQFSLNLLFYQNHDSLFYINSTSGVSLASIESRVKWVSSKLPWANSLPEDSVSLVQLQYEDGNSVIVTEATSVPSEKKEVIQLNDHEKIKENSDKEKSADIKLEVVSPTNKTKENEGVGKSPLHSISSSASKPHSMDIEEVHLKVSDNESHVNVTVASERESVETPSKMFNTSIKDRDAKQSKIPQVGDYIKTVLNKSESKNTTEDNRVLLSKEKPLCPPVPPHLVGSLKIHRKVPTIEEQERRNPELEPGGRFRPANCRARHRVAVIIPYRDRVKHLAMFLYHIHPILQRQQIDYAVYVIEQAGSVKFNRAMLLNVGALEALKQYQYDCFIFHDVDLLPEDDRNLYTCPEQPRHMSIAIDSMNYRLPYNDIFGGVSAMTVEQFRIVNGFSNKFWGWGGEDDDMSNRIKYHGFFISRYPANIGRYTMLSHRKDEPNPRRYQYLYEGKKRFKSDGLNSAKYRALDVQLRRLYTWVYVDLFPS